MCTWSYLHHHHIPPCTRPIDMVVHYSYCQNADQDPVTGTDVPCPMTYFAEDYQVDYNDPCATGGCLISPDCASGLCRLAQLGGRWACCACGGRGNALRACRQRLRTSPDTFCYHVCCETCRADSSPPVQPSTTAMIPSSYSSSMVVPTSTSSSSLSLSYSSATGSASMAAAGVVVTTAGMEGVGGGGSGTAVASGSGSGSSASGSRTRRGREVMW